MAVPASDRTLPSDQVSTTLLSDSGRTIDIDLFSPQDDSLRGPDDNFNGRLANMPALVNNLTNISSDPFEPICKAAYDSCHGAPETRLDAAVGSGKAPR